MFKQKSQNSPLRIAIVGHRGIPNSYGGFETLAEELASSLVGLGCSVTVYCRKNYFADRPETYKGASLIYLQTLSRKTLDTFYHTFISIWHVFFKNTADVVLIVNVGNAPSALLAKLLGKKVVFCVDGLDWQRKKWGKVARTYLKACSYVAKYVAHEVVTDAASVHDFYKKDRKTESTHIPYGTEIETLEEGEEILREYNLEPKKYFIYVARFEPENNPLMVVKAHAESKSNLPLVMVGDNRYNPAFVDQIKAAAGKNVIFTGYAFGSRYKQLLKNSLASVRAAEVGGISPAVIEAMGRSVCMIANDKPENREPIGDAGVFYKLNVHDLAGHFRNLSQHPDKAVLFGKKAAQRAMILYSWDRIGYEYFKVIKKAVGQTDSAKTVVALSKDGNKKKILITGAAGMLGNSLYDYLSKDYTVRATALNPRESWQYPLDVTDFDACEREVQLFRPDFIFHLAALTNLEECEKDLPRAYAVNALSVKYMAQLSAKYGAKLVYTSTANIFDGEKRIYTEADEPAPLNVYGLTKHIGELMAKYYAPNNLIIRLGWLIGGGPLLDKKFVSRIVEQIGSGAKELKVVSDKFGTISYTRDVAKTIGLLLSKNAEGVYHAVSPGVTNRYEIAQKIVSVLGYKSMVRVVPVNSDHFATVFSTPRPVNECLLNGRLKDEGIYTLRTWEDALQDYLEKDFAYALSNTSALDIFPDIATA